MNLSKLLIGKALVYRLMALVVHTILFGAKVAIGVNAVNLFGYFMYDFVFFKLFKFGKETKGKVIWLTGLPCSGKSTIAEQVTKKLEAENMKVINLDGDVVRTTLCKGLGFSEADRLENLTRVAYTAHFLQSQNSIVLCSFVSPYRHQREIVKEIIGAENFLEVFVDTPVEECIKRDVKGMYKKALAGEIPKFTGISDPYEIPLVPNLIIQTEHEKEKVSVNKLIKFIKSNI